MVGKQLFDKSGESYRPITPITTIQNIIDNSSKERLDSILIKFNHIYIPFEISVTNTRNKVPIVFRRNGLTISYYDSINNKAITEHFIGSDNAAKSSTSWVLNKNWDRILYSSDIGDNDIKLHVPNSSLTWEMLSDSLKQIFITNGGTIVNYPDEEDLTIRKSTFNNNATLLSFKDREVNLSEFISEGIKILRRRFSPVEGNADNAKTYYFNGFINETGCKETTALYIDNDTVNKNNIDDIILYDVYNHRFVLRSYKIIQNINKTVYFPNWTSEDIKFNNSIYYNYYNNTLKSFYPQLNTIFIDINTNKKYYFNNNYEIKEVTNNIYYNYTNIITQEDFNKESTIYIIKYDFDLNGKTINIPADCTLKFEGGKLLNGTINLNNTYIQNVNKNINEYISTITGTYGEGQIIYKDNKLFISLLNEDTTVLKEININL